MNSQNPLNMLKSRAGKISLSYFAAFIFLGMTTASLGPTLDALSQQASAGLDKISWVFPIRSFGYLIGSVIAGRLYDKLNGHRLMGFALIIMAGTMAFIPTVPLFAVLLISLLVIGLGEGMLDVGGNTLIVWLHKKQVGPYMNALHFFFGVGALLAPLVVGEVLKRTEGIAWAYWLIAIASIPAIIGIAGTKSPVNSRLNEENDDESINEPSKSLIVLLVLFFIFYVAAEVSYGGWVYLYSTTAVGISTVNAAYITAAFWGAFTFGRLIGILINTKLKPKSILQFNFIGSILSLSIILIWPFETWAIWLGSIGFGFSIASIFPTMITYAGSRITVTGKITGYFFLGATIGGMVLPWAIGQFFESIGPAIMSWSVTISMLLAILTAVGVAEMFKRHRQTTSS